MWLRLMKNVGHRSSLFTTETGLKVWKGRFYGSSSTTRTTTTTTTTTTSNNFTAGKSGKKSNDTINHIDIPIVDFDDPDYLPLADYPKRLNETLEVKKQRLLYQSRKRGMLENDLLLSTFAAKYLKDLNPKLTEQYDRLINGVSNDWDIYYWATNRKSTPIQYDNDIMRMLKDHVKNVNREPRLRQPNL